MGLPRQKIPLPSFYGGLNLHQEEAQRDQVVRGRNVFFDEGVLRRRPVYRSILASAPMRHPRGATHCITYAWDTRTAGAAPMTVSSNSGLVSKLETRTGFLIYGLRSFSGIDWRNVSWTPGTPTHPYRLNLLYQNAAQTWLRMPWFMDDTHLFHATEDAFRIPLVRNGCIHWHPDELAGWAAHAGVTGLEGGAFDSDLMFFVMGLFICDASLNQVVTYGTVPAAPVVDTVYSITINGTTYSHTASATDTQDDVTDALALAIDRGIEATTSRFAGVLTLTAKEPGQLMLISSSNFTAPTETTTTSILSTLPGTGSVGSVGVGVFDRPPVNGIIHMHTGEGRPSMLLGADRPQPRGVEQGANLGIVEGLIGTARMALVVADEGSGVLGTKAWPAFWERANYTVNPATVAQAATGSVGNAGNILRKGLRKSPGWGYSWRDNQWFARFLKTNSNPAVGTTGRRVLFSWTDTNNLDGHYEHCLLWVNRDPLAVGLPYHEYKEIYRYELVGGTPKIFVWPSFVLAPAVSQGVDIMGPPATLRSKRTGREYRVLEGNFLQDGTPAALDTDDDLLLWDTTGKPYWSDALHLDDDNDFVFWELGWLTRWAIPSGVHGHGYSATIDPGNREMLLTNGRSGLLRFDGDRLRRFVPDVSSALAEIVAGKIPVDANLGVRIIVQPETVLRKELPPGRFLATAFGRIFMAGIPGRENDIIYSWHEGGHRIWPQLSYSTIRDDENADIKGLFTLGRRFFAFTSNSIHEGGMVSVDDTFSRLAMQPVVKGTGFLSHQAVDTVDLPSGDVIVGPSADGLVAFDGFITTRLLDEWDKVIEGGVADELLERAVGATWRSRGLYFCGLARKGSTRNDCILVYDYRNHAFWDWDAPFGVTSLEVRHFANGQEQLLIGTSDGMVQTLVYGGPDDDGKAFTWTVRTAPIRPAKDNECFFSALSLLIKPRGSWHTMTFRGFLDRAQKASFAYESVRVSERGGHSFPSPGYSRTGLPTHGPQITEDSQHLVDSMLGININVDEELHTASGLTYLDAPNTTTLQTTRNASRDMFITRRLQCPRWARGHTFQAELEGTEDVHIKNWELLFSVAGQHGTGPSVKTTSARTGAGDSG